MSTTLHTTVVLDALSLALAMRRPRGVHSSSSDRGSRCTSIEFGNRCRPSGCAGLRWQSVGDTDDNAMAESFFATLECELLAAAGSKRKPRRAMPSSSFIEGFYNNALSAFVGSDWMHQSSSSGGAGRVRLPPRTPSCYCARSRQGQALRGRAKCATLTAPARDGVSNVRAGTEGWAQQGPNERMGPSRRKSRRRRTP